MDIDSVIARMADGDRDAFARVIETYQRPLFGFLGRMGINRAEAAEVAQETFLRAWRHIGQYRRDRAEFSTWLFSIARNLALNELTRAAAKREVSQEVTATTALSPEPGPVDQLAREQSHERLRQALDRLPIADRTALALVYVQELPLASVAALEGTTVAAVKTRIHRAKAKLREWLELHDE